MNLKELGNVLRTEREKQGLSLEDVYDQTKISLGNLRAIEEGRIDDLPHPVYAKGFVKNYAHMLGMDSDEMAKEFTRNFTQAEFIGEEYVPEVQEDIQPPEPEEKDRKWTFVSVFLTVVLLAVLGWLVYDVFLIPQTQTAEQGVERPAAANETGSQQAKEKEPAEPATASTGQSRQQTEEQQEGEQASSELPLPPSNATQTGGRTAQTESGGDNASAGSSSLEANETIAWDEVNNGTQDSQAAAEEPEPASQSEELEAAVETTQEAAQPPSKHVLEVSSTEACWLRAEVDDKERDMYLRPGESVTFRFKESLLLKLGNAGGVELVYDGEPYDLEAKSGEVKTVRFP
jgi:cytoskeleton protein RodZ